MSSSLKRISKPLKDEFERQKKEKARRKAERGNFSFKEFIVKWVKRLFYTFCMFMLLYVFIVGGTILIPTVMGYLVGSMGYSLSNSGELLLAQLAGLFFTAWVFAIGFLAIRFAWHRYIEGMQGTLPKQAADRLSRLKDLR